MTETVKVLEKKIELKKVEAKIKKIEENKIHQWSKLVLSFFAGVLSTIFVYRVF